jgi:hypothetical protein
LVRAANPLLKSSFGTARPTNSASDRPVRPSTPYQSTKTKEWGSGGNSFPPVCRPPNRAKH